MTRLYKKGDNVRCIKLPNWSINNGVGETLGGIYTVAADQLAVGHGIALVGSTEPAFTFSSHRFELVEEDINERAADMGRPMTWNETKKEFVYDE